MRHGGPVPAPLEAATSDDPDAQLAAASMAAWSASHPCTCDVDDPDAEIDRDCARCRDAVA